MDPTESQEAALHTAFFRPTQPARLTGKLTPTEKQRQRQSNQGSGIMEAEPKTAPDRLLLPWRWRGDEGPTLTHKTSASCSLPPTPLLPSGWQAADMEGQVSAHLHAPTHLPAPPRQSPQGQAEAMHTPRAWLLPHPAHSTKGLLVLSPKPPSGPSPGWHPGLTQFLPRGSRQRKEEGV